MTGPTSPEAAGADGSTVLEARDVCRDFGALRAVDGVSFTLGEGRLLTVFGPNGAGKTTLLRVLGGGLTATKGRVLVRGHPLGDGSREWQGSIGFLSHQTFLYGHLTARENLRFYASLYGLQNPGSRIVQGLEAVGLQEWADRPVRSFSRGMRQRLALARTLLHEPEVVLLDEPYTGLDAHAAALLNQVLASLKDGRRTVVLVTHNLIQGLELADRVAIQVRGSFAFLDDRSRVDSADFERFYRQVVDGRLASPTPGSS